MVKLGVGFDVLNSLEGYEVLKGLMLLERLNFLPVDFLLIKESMPVPCCIY